MFYRELGSLSRLGAAWPPSRRVGQGQVARSLITASRKGLGTEVGQSLPDYGKQCS